MPQPSARRRDTPLTLALLQSTSAKALAQLLDRLVADKDYKLLRQCIKSGLLHPKVSKAVSDAIRPFAKSTVRTEQLLYDAWMKKCGKDPKTLACELDSLAKCRSKTRKGYGERAQELLEQGADYNYVPRGASVTPLGHLLTSGLADADAVRREILDFAGAKNPDELPMGTRKLNILDLIAQRGFFWDQQYWYLHDIAGSFDVTRPAIRRAGGAALRRFLDGKHSAEPGRTGLLVALGFVQLRLADEDAARRLWSHRFDRPATSAAGVGTDPLQTGEPTMNLAEAIARLAIWWGDPDGHPHYKAARGAIDALVGYGIDLNDAPSWRHLPLASAIALSHVDYVKALIRHGAKVELVAPHLPGTGTAELVPKSPEVATLLASHSARDVMQAMFSSLDLPPTRRFRSLLSARP